ncbi:SDR family NAD(P)-dependent oxidoreductase [Caldisericum sp.]|uniref:SDR family NAD(P)-dependent oxidoreductase n=1 Tax=Caldisericum sp. TaxID=2499687 RepID=UPI003D110A54
MNIKDKVAVITGGSRGIGEATALALAERGANVAIVFNIHKEEAGEVRKKCLEKGRKAEIYQCDVSNFKNVKETIDKIVKDFGRVDILVNNAGIYIKKTFLETDESTWDKTIDVNLKGVFNCCRFTIPYMLKEGHGKIINISSVAARHGGRLAVSVPYIASKAGVIGITKALAKQFTSKGILVSGIAPDHVETDMLINSAHNSDLEIKEVIKNIPVGRLCKPEEIAHTVIFLVENDYMVGETIDVSGGTYFR